jgi:hypothetical protein
MSFNCGQDEGERGTNLGPAGRAASPSILAKLSAARAAVEGAGFGICGEDWHSVTSEKLGEVNAPANISV